MGGEHHNCHSPIPPLQSPILPTTPNAPHPNPYFSTDWAIWFTVPVRIKHCLASCLYNSMTKRELLTYNFKGQETVQKTLRGGGGFSIFTSEICPPLQGLAEDGFPLHICNFLITPHMCSMDLFDIIQFVILIISIWPILGPPPPSEDW